MLKHSDLTSRRIDQFLDTILAPDLIGSRSPLKIEINENPAVDQREAEAGPWKTVEKGHQYGPAYQVFWFRISGSSPSVPEGHQLGILADIGGERTVWRDNSPWCGIDREHTIMGLAEGERSWASLPTPEGDKLQIYIQVYTNNSETTVHGKEKPRSPLTETVQKAEAVVVNRPLLDLYYDVDFGKSLLSTLDQAGAGYARLLRGLNTITNEYRPGDSATIAICRRIFAETIRGLKGASEHTIVPVGHAHLDTAWLWPINITMKKMAHTASTQLQLLDRYPEYVFAHSQASQYEWLETQYPALFERVKAAIRRGQWEPVGSMWVEADCNLTGAESLVRQFLYGRRYFKQKLGYETQDMWLPDVFGYSAALPQILKKFNIQYFLTQKISWNQFNKFPHHTFWWQGIDGTRVWTHFPPADTYNASCEPKEVAFSVKNYKDHARSDQSLYVFGHGDGGGGPTERHLEFLRRGRLTASYPEVASGKRALDFFRDAKARSRDLMTWVGELYLELHRGTYTSQAANKLGNRTSEFLLRDAEWLSCFRPDYPTGYPATELEAAWKLVLLNQFHDIIPGSSVREVYEDSDKDYAQIKVVGDQVIAHALTKIGEAFDTSAFNRPVALFANADMVSQAEIPWPEEAVPVSIIAGDEHLPVQLVEEFGERKIIFPTPVSALGAVSVADLIDTVPTSKFRLKGSGRRIENSELAVKFDLHGNLTSIQSLEDGAEFIEPGKLGNMFQLLEDKPLFWSAWDVDIFAFETAQDLLKSESFEIVEKGPVRVAAEVVKKFGNSTIKQRISLGPTPGVRFDTEIDWHEEDKMLKVAFPLNVNAARATYEIQFGNVERPTHVNTSWDMARFEVCAQKWVDVSEGDMGAALLNNGKYGHDVRNNVLRLSLLRSAKAPDPLCDMGRHRFSYSLVPHYSNYNYAGIVQAAYAFNSPTRHAFLDHHAGEQGMLPPLVNCEDRNIVVEAVKRAEDSSDLVVRLYECHNTRGHAELSVARQILGAALCDLEENELSELEVTDGLISFDYKPFEIITIRVRV